MKRGIKRGHESETRLYAILNEKDADTPSWFLDIKQADLIFDAGGIDAFIRIRVEGKSIPIDIPVQIKSSNWGVGLHNTKFPELWIAQVPVFVVNDSKSDAMIRKEVFDSLADIRNKGLTFDSIISSIIRERRSLPRKILQKIKENRRLFSRTS